MAEAGNGQGSAGGAKPPVVGPLVRTWWRQGHPYLVFLALVPVALVIVGHALGWEWVGGPSSKYTYEVVAVPLTAAAAGLFALRALVTRSRVCVLLAVQAAIFCCREIHFAGTHKGVYVATALVVVWAVFWAARHRDRLRPENVDWWQTGMVVAAVATYAAAMLIQKRVFKFVPGEQDLHVPLEEATESVAHVWLLLSAVVGSWRRSAAERGADNGPRLG